QERPYPSDVVEWDDESAKVHQARREASDADDPPGRSARRTRRRAEGTLELRHRSEAAGRSGQLATPNNPTVPPTAAIILRLTINPSALSANSLRSLRRSEERRVGKEY